MSEKKTKGKQKIDIKKIENEENKLITFSKRRSGIYKKASELCTLTGSEVAFLVFSPAGKPFSFATSSIEYVAGCYLGLEPPQPLDSTYPIVEAHRQMRINDLTEQHNELVDKAELTKENNKRLKEKVSGKNYKGWWEANTDELNQQELADMKNRFKNLHVNLNAILHQKRNAESCAFPAPPVDPNDVLTDPFTSNPDDRRIPDQRRFPDPDPKGKRKVIE